jgi:hypothetical protein
MSKSNVGKIRFHSRIAVKWLIAGNVLNSESEPIALDMSSKPYKIIDGRHRVYLARQKGYTEVRAVSA